MLFTGLVLCTLFAFSQANTNKNLKKHVLITLDNIPTKAERINLAKRGVLLESYVSGTSYYATIDTELYNKSSKTKSSIVSSVEDIDVESKLDKYLQSGQIPDYAIASDGVAKVMVKYFMWSDIKQINSDIDKLRLRNVEFMKQFRMIKLDLPFGLITKFASLNWVSRVECVPPPYVFENYNGRSVIQANVLQKQGIGNRGLSGKGINLAMWDGNVYNHPDLGSRLHSEELKNVSEHGQHVSGTMAGSGLIDPYGKGIAYGSQVFAYNFNVGNTLVEMLGAARKYGVSITQNSYGVSAAGFCDNPYTYNMEDQGLDMICNYVPQMLHVFSVGNDQKACGGAPRFLTSTKRAKNAVFVGAVDKMGDMSSFSSWGPTDDGRLIPHISSMGVKVYSTVYSNKYSNQWSGTSMACPSISGLLSLMSERYKQLNDTLPIGSLLKAALLNTADDRGNVGPDYKFGFGIANGERAVEVFENQQFTTGVLANGEKYEQKINIPNDATELRVMLVWADKESDALTKITKALINDLDLVVVKDGVEYLPWVLDPSLPHKPATKGKDRVNNQEQVTIQNPKGGEYTIRVKGHLIPEINQQYSLVYYYTQPELTLTYPLGGEKVQPGDEMIVRWNSEGLDGNVMVEMSYDGGQTYTTLSENVSRKELSVVIPEDAPITNNAKIRIIQDNKVSVTNEPFTIMTRPQNVKLMPQSCSLSGWSLSWDAVAGATSYDILKADQANGVYNSIGTSTSTNFNIPELTIEGRNIYTVVAVKGEVRSERAYAVIANPSETVGQGEKKFPIKENFTSVPSSIVQVNSGKNVEAVYEPTGFGKEHFLRLNATNTSNSTWNSSDIFSNTENVVTSTICVDATDPKMKKLTFKLFAAIQNAADNTAGFKVMVGNEDIANSLGQTSITSIQKGHNYMAWNLDKFVGTKFELKIVSALKQKVVSQNQLKGDFILFARLSLVESFDDLALSNLEIPKQNVNLPVQDTVRVRIRNNSDKAIKDFKLRLFVNGNSVAEETFTKELPPFRSVIYKFKKKINLSTLEKKYVIKAEVIYDNDAKPENNIVEGTTYNLGNYVLMPNKYAEVVKKVSEKLYFTDDGAKMLNYSDNYSGGIAFEAAKVGERVKLTFNKLDLKENDEIIIRKGKYKDSPVLAKLTGITNEPITFISELTESDYIRGCLYVGFESSLKNNAKGWIATVEPTTEEPTNNYNNNIVALSSIVNQNGYFKTPQTLRVKVLNNTNKPIENAKVQYNIDGGAWTTPMNIGSLKQGESIINIEPKADLSELKRYIVKVKIMHDNDVYEKDNIISKVLENTKYCMPSAYNKIKNELFIVKVEKDGVANVTQSSGQGIEYTQNYTTDPFDFYANIPNQVLNVTINKYRQGAKLGLWVDWNDNGKFTDANEVLGPIICKQGQTEYPIVISAPTSVVADKVYRVRVKISNGTDITNPCGDIEKYVSSGEIEDYAFKVIKGLEGKDISPIACSLEDGVDLTNAETVKVTIENKGTESVSSFKVSIKVDDNPAVEETVNQKISAGNKYEYTFTHKADLSKAGLHKVIIKTILADDKLSDNDELIVEVLNQKPVEDGFFALNFNGIDDGVNLGTLGKANIHKSTYEAWMNPVSYGRNGGPVGFGRLFEGKNATIFLCRTNDNYPDECLVVNAEGVMYYSGAHTIKLNQYQHIAVTIGSTKSDVKLYINGKSVGLTQMDANANFKIKNNSNSDLWVGNNADGSRAFDGIIDEVRVWNKVLSASEIKSGMYKHQAGASGLIAEFNFDEGYYNKIVSSGNFVGHITSNDLSENGIWKQNDFLLEEMSVNGQVSEWKDLGNGKMRAEVGQGVDRTKLISTFKVTWPNTKVKIGTVEQKSGVTVNNFGNSETTPVEYTLTANVFGKNLTEVKKVVVISELSTECKLLSLSLGAPVSHDFTTIASDMTCAVNANDNISAVPTNFTLSDGASLYVNDKKIKDGDNIDYTNAVVLKVVAANGRTTGYYTVFVKKQQNITWGIAEISKTYGDEQFNLNATSTSGKDITYVSSNPDFIIVTGNKARIKGVGSGTITAYLPSSANFEEAASVTKNFKVEKANLTVTADDKAVDFTDVIPELTMTFDGFVYNEDESSLNELPKVSTAAKQYDAPGSYDITVSGGADDNYSFTYKKGQLLINNVTTRNITFKVTYDGKPQADVDIAINGSTIKTKSNGQVSIKLKEQEYKYVATKAGLEPEEGMINVTKDETIAITMIKELPVYEVRYESNGNGRLDGALVQHIKKGKNGEPVIAVPDFGYKLQQWSDGSVEKQHIISDVQKDETITATFEIKKYKLTYNPGEHGTISGKAEQTVTHGQNGTKVTAVPDEGYAFISWSDGEKANPRTDKEVVSDITVTAIYSKSYSKLPYIQPFNEPTVPEDWTVVDVAETGVEWNFKLTFSGEKLEGSSSNVAVIESPEDKQVDAELLSPIFDFSEYANVSIKFIHFFKLFDSGYGSLSYSINGGAWKNIKKWTKTTTNSETYSKELPDLAGQKNVQFKWKYVAIYWEYYWAIDNVEITGEKKADSYTYTYSAGENGTLEGADENGQVTGKAKAGTQGPSVKAIANEGFYFEKWSDGVKVNPRTDIIKYSTNVVAKFRSKCNPISTLPYSENFDNGEMPDCWKAPKVMNYRWDVGSTKKILEGGAAFFNAVSVGYLSTVEASLISPKFDLSNYKSVYISFKHLFLTMMKARKVKLSYSVNGGKKWNLLKEWQKDDNFIAFKYESIKAPKVGGKSDVSFKWTYVGGMDYGYILDDVELRESKSYLMYYQAGSEKVAGTYIRRGRIIGDSIQTVEEGAKSTPVLAAAYDGYKFVKWSDGVTDNPRIDSNIDKDSVVTAMFAKAEFKYIVEYKTVDGKGSITASVYGKPIKSGDKVDETKQVVFTIVPEKGYLVKSWYLNGDKVAGEQGKTFVVNNLQNDIKVVAEYEKATDVNFFVSSETGVVSGATLAVAGEVLTTDENGEAHLRMQQGQYTYVVTKDGFDDKNGTFDVGAEEMTVSIDMTSVGIHQSAFANVTIMPNPFNNELTIAGLTNVKTVKIYDVTGKLINAISNVSSDRIVLDTDNMTQGVYVVKLVNNNGQVDFRKVVKK